MNKIVVYTPAENFWYNSDLGPILLIWFISLMIGVVIVAGTFGGGIKGRGNLKPWQLIGLTGCVTYAIHWFLVG